jgi:hypothetical protein
MLILIEVDPMAFWGLIVAIISAVIALVAAVAAIYAAVYAKAAPTRDDLIRVEQNTAATSKRLATVHDHLAAMTQDLKRVEGHTAEASGHLENVHSEISRLNQRMDKEPGREALRSLATRVRARILGSIEREAPTAIFTVGTEAGDVKFTRVDLVSKNRSLVQVVPCEMKSYPNMQQATVEMDGATFKRWLMPGRKRAIWIGRPISRCTWQSKAMRERLTFGRRLTFTLRIRRLSTRRGMGRG